MESGFRSTTEIEPKPEWDKISYIGSGHFEFFRVRRFGALHFVKRPSPKYRHDLVTTESLKKEFNIGYSLNHPSIVRYLDMEDGAVYEEYIDGLSLREMIDKGDERLHSPEFLERVCRQLIEASAYLHSRGIIHNDIKPENVMVSRIDNQVKLVDLGCAYADMWDTTQGYTPAYKAPEQGKGETNVYTDIFLIGKLMEELAPLAEDDKRWRKFVFKATAENIEERFGSDNEAMAAIPHCKKTSWPHIMIGAVLALGVAAGVIAWLSGRNHKENGDMNEPFVAEQSIPTEKAYDMVDTVDTVETVVAAQPTTDSAESHPEDGSASRQETVVPPQPQTPHEIVERKIREYVMNKYNKEVFPECRKYEKMPDAVARYRQDAYIRYKVMQNAINDVQQYAETLAAQYPSEASYVRMEATTLLDAQQSQAGVMLENSFRKFMDDRVDPDTANAIIREYIGL